MTATETPNTLISFAPYATTLGTILVATISTLGINYASESRRAERTKSLIENKVALLEKNADDKSSMEIRARLDELILLTLQTDIDKSTRLNWKQIIKRVSFVGIIILSVVVFAFYALRLSSISNSANWLTIAPIALSTISGGIAYLFSSLSNRSSKPNSSIEIVDNHDGTMSFVMDDEKDNNKKSGSSYINPRLIFNVIAIALIAFIIYWLARF